MSPIDLARLIWPEPNGTAEALHNKVAEDWGIAVRSAAREAVAATGSLARPFPPATLNHLSVAGSVPLLPLVGPELCLILASSIHVFLGDGEVLRLAVLQNASSDGDQEDLIWAAVIVACGEAFATIRPLFERGPVDVDLLKTRGLHFPVDVRMESARKLATTTFRNPLPSQRWRSHGQEIRSALKARASRDESSLAQALEDVTAEALIVASHEADQSYDQIFLTLNGARRKVVNAHGGLIPRVALPERLYEAWFRNRVADQMMDQLVPGYRETEAQRREGFRASPLLTDAQVGDGEEISLSELWALTDPDPDPEEQAVANDSVAELGEHLAGLGPDQRDLVLLVSDGLSEADAAN